MRSQRRPPRLRGMEADRGRYRREAPRPPPPPPPGPRPEGADPAGCVEWKQTAVDTGEKLVATAHTDPEAAGQMACSALSDTQWETYLGTGFYRYVEGGTCTASSQDNQLMVRAAVITGKSWS